MELKYIYINSEEDRVTLISKKKEDDHPDTEYVVSHDFDMTKDMGDGVMLEGFLTATEFLERYNGDYKQRRINAYPSIGDQLDKIYREGIDAWKADITAIKEAHPKPEE